MKDFLGTEITVGATIYSVTSASRQFKSPKPTLAKVVRITPSGITILKEGEDKTTHLQNMNRVVVVDKILESK